MLDIDKNIPGDLADRIRGLYGQPQEPDRQGERAQTHPLRSARKIAIHGIQPDPNQPRKRSTKKRSNPWPHPYKEPGGIIGPVTVRNDKADTHDGMMEGPWDAVEAKLQHRAA